MDNATGLYFKIGPMFLLVGKIMRHVSFYVKSCVTFNILAEGIDDSSLFSGSSDVVT
jgi:hypothetical protein